MKSRIKQTASIGGIFLLVTIFSLVLAGSRTQAQTSVTTSVHVHKGAATLFSPGVNEVLAEVTAVCTGGTGTVFVTITQTAAQSNANVPASGSGSSAVKCDGQSREIAVSVGASYANLGQATAVATLEPPSGPAVAETQTILIGFPVIGVGD